MSDCRLPVAPPTREGRDFDVLLAELRDRGAQRFDPVRFRFIESLARRAATHRGEVRRILDVRLAAVLAEYGGRFETAQPAADAGFGGGCKPAAATDAKRPRGPLGDLVEQLARHGLQPVSDSLDGSAAAHAGPPGELKALRDFRSTWVRLRVDQQLSQSLAKGPGNAGPLNSHRLVLRSLKLMHEMSPAYLARFASHVEALLWLDQANGGSAAVQVMGASGERDKKRKPGRRKLQPVR